MNKQLLSDLTPNLKHLPIRIYVDDGAIVQDLIPPTLPGLPAGRATTLVDVLRHCLPTLFPLPPGSRRGLGRPKAAVAAPAPSAGTATGDDDEASLLSGAAGGADDGSVQAEDDGASVHSVADETAEVATFASAVPTEVIIQGVRPQPETPVVWLSDHLAYPDGFVHVAVRRLPSAL